MFIYYLSKFFKVSNILILNFHDLNILKNEKFVVIWKCVGLIMLLHYDYIFSGIKWSLKWQ